MEPEHKDQQPSKSDFPDIWAKACQAGCQAAENVTVKPMIVYSETKPFSGIADTTKPIYNVPDGPCGFAWVVVRPGNGPFARWLKQNSYGKYSSYDRGVMVWISHYNQSVTRKAAYAQAMAQVLRDHGIRASAYVRLD